MKVLCQEPYPVAQPDNIKQVPISSLYDFIVCLVVTNLLCSVHCQFNETLLAYRSHLQEICAEPSGNLLIDGCLRSLYKEMVQQQGRPCVAASVVLALFSNTKIPMAVRWMLSREENGSDEALTRVYETLARWLGETTSVDNLDVWICELIAGLFEERRFDLLFDLAVTSAPLLLHRVKIPVFRAQILPVLQRLLVCDGRAPKLFHAVLPRLCEVIRLFNGQIQEQEIRFLRTIQELLLQFPESGDRYKEIVSSRVG